jgi:hypothetical protein
MLVGKKWKDTDERLTREKEHSVMYPIDLLKVCLVSRRCTLPCTTDPVSTDPHASRQPYSCGDLHRHRQRDLDHIKSRGIHVIVEGRLKCSTRRR